MIYMIPPERQDALRQRVLAILREHPEGIRERDLVALLAPELQVPDEVRRALAVIASEAF